MHSSTSLSRLLLVILSFAASDIVAAEDYLWVEGEAASSRKVQPHNWYSDAVKKEQLSEGAWISHFTDQADGVASYTLNVPAEAEYALWVRANVIGALLSYQVNDGDLTIDSPMEYGTVHVISLDDQPSPRRPFSNSNMPWDLLTTRATVIIVLHTILDAPTECRVIEGVGRIYIHPKLSLPYHATRYSIPLQTYELHANSTYYSNPI